MATLPQLAPLPTEDEKTLAMLNYILSIFAGFLAPLIIWLVKRDSKFVAFHALQMLFWHCIYLAVTFMGIILFVFGVVASGGSHGAESGVELLFVLLIWGGGMLNIVLAIVFAIKAKRGEWTRLPIVGNWARRATGLASN